MLEENLIPDCLKGYVYFSSPGILEAKGKLPSRLIKIFEETKAKIYKDFLEKSKKTNC